jgi:hypothetical protein
MAESTQEIWRDVPEWPGYAVSDQGQVRLKRGTVTRGGVERNGYLRVTFSQGKVIKHFWVHRLVAQAFIPNPDNKPEVNHLGAKTDNRSCMLEWATTVENVAHANANITVRATRAVEQLDPDTGEVIKRYNAIVDTEEDGFSRKNICECIKKGGLHGRFRWRYAEEKIFEEIKGEQWRSLKDSIYPEVAKFEQYEVSDHARVRHVRTGMRTVNKTKVILHHNNETSDFLLHRLVLMAFNVPNPESKPEVDHIDSNCDNHHLTNLRWATARENMNNPATRAKLGAVVRKDTRWMRVTFPDQHQETLLGIKAVAQRVGISEATIRKYIAGDGFGPRHRFEWCNPPQ